MRKPLLSGRSNRADVDGARSSKQGESEIYGNRDGDGQPSVRKIEGKRQVGALRERMRSLPDDGEAQNAIGRTDSPRRRFPHLRLSFCGKGVPSAAETCALP